MPPSPPVPAEPSIMFAPLCPGHGHTLPSRARFSAALFSLRKRTLPGVTWGPQFLLRPWMANMPMTFVVAAVMGSRGPACRAFALTSRVNTLRWARLREGQELAQGHTADKWQSWDPSPECLDPKLGAHPLALSHLDGHVSGTEAGLGPAFPGTSVPGTPTPTHPRRGHSGLSRSSATDGLGGPRLP